MKVKNINTFKPKKTGDELLRNLFNNNSIRIELIESKGAKSPEGFWYETNEKWRHDFYSRTYETSGRKDFKKCRVAGGSLLITMGMRLKNIVIRYLVSSAAG